MTYDKRKYNQSGVLGHTCCEYSPLIKSCQKWQQEQFGKIKGLLERTYVFDRGRRIDLQFRLDKRYFMTIVPRFFQQNFSSRSDKFFSFALGSKFLKFQKPAQRVEMADCRLFLVPGILHGTCFPPAESLSLTKPVPL